MTTTSTSRLPTAIVAVGGNSLIADTKHQKVDDQWNAVRTTTTHIAGMIERGWNLIVCLLYTSPSPRDRTRSRMPSSA